MKFPLKNILRNFLNHVDELEIRRKLNDDQYEVEFQKLKQLTDTLKWDPDCSCVHGLKDVNRPKNRYKDIVPYDFCRVILPECSGIPGSDYVNASHVKGASGAFAYIAAQGPLPNTVVDFWRMIWVCDVQVIIMACNEREGGKTKCESYWPEAGGKRQYGTLSVKFLSQTQVCPDFLVRTLLVCQESETREIWQFHYTSWPDHGIPDTVQPILDMVRLVRDCQASETAPILVHCSAGCGRTGTICAIDFIWACLRTGKLTENFCLYDIVAEMRRQRIAMVQTKEQYMLVHKAVAAMFEQQLNIIDSHTYENLDRDGAPLSWRNTVKGNNLNFETFASLEERNVVSLETTFNDKVEMEHHEAAKPLQPSLATDAGSMKNYSSGHGSCNFAEWESSTKNEKNNESSETLTSEWECKHNADDDVNKENESASHSHSSALVLSSPESADSIPFIDDDDTKSDIQVRARCGRAYLHIPSCDSISKIVNRFDPFADKVWTDMEESCPESNHSLPTSVAEPSSISESSSVFSSFDRQMNSRSGSMRLKPIFDPPNHEKSIKTVEISSQRDSVKNDGSHISLKTTGSVSESVHSSSRRCSSTISEIEDSASGGKSSNDLGKGFSRRPSIVKLKGFFERASKGKNNGKTSLFRHHSHHVSRAGSAPPCLDSMKRKTDNEKESVFALVTRKFRSSSVKSEQELQKEGSSSHLSTLKRTAMTSLSHLKQNISNFSRNVALSVHRTSNKQAPTSNMTHRNSLKSSQLNSPVPIVIKENVSPPIVTSTELDTSQKFDGQSQNSCKIEKLPVSFNYSDGREGAQQKFVVNVLSSNHGQNVVMTGKNSVFQGISEKNNSPKIRNFMSDFECLKTNPVRLLGRGTSRNVTEPSSLWYGSFEDDHSSNDENSTLSRKHARPAGLPEDLLAAKSRTNDAKTLDRNLKLNSQSVFYTDLKQKSNPSTPNKGQDLIDMPEKVGTSSFFWPMYSYNGSCDVKKNISEADTTNMDSSLATKEFHPKLDLDSVASKFENRLDDPPKNEVKMTSSRERESFLFNSLPILGKSAHVEPSPSLMADSARQLTVQDVSLLKNKLGEESSARLANVNTSETLRNDIKGLSQIGDQKINVNHHHKFLEPPALPKKTVIGRNRPINSLMNKTSEVSPEAILDSEKHSKVPTVQENVKVSNFHQSQVPKSPVENVPVLVEDLKNSIDKADAKVDLYINVNIVAKKNIEQIESTLRNHPRGAIIDLTSRQSYSMEEELTNAVQKLPEPTKISKSSSSLAAKRAAGYEVIWPETRIANSEISKKVNEVLHGPIHKKHEFSFENQVFKGISTVTPLILNQPKKSGLCYSPPLRRSVMSNFPVLKSRSCASLDWLQNTNNDTTFTNKQDAVPNRKNSSETLVNEAVVELSTLLDELTTKTLTDDLVLDSPRTDRRSPSVSNQGTHVESGSIAQPTVMNMDISDTPAARVNSPHKYETIYLPQKQALSIKNGDEEEIIFHFPPPPRIPPPPPNDDSVAESFEIMRKNGALHLSGSQKTDMSINTDTNFSDSLEIANRSDSSPKPYEISDFSIPIPVPRKAKQTTRNSPGSLRRSASYSSLVSQAVTESPGNDFSDRPQTLPRLQDPDCQYAVEQQSPLPTLSKASPTEDEKKTETLANPYETLFPNSAFPDGNKKGNFGSREHIEVELKSLESVQRSIRNVPSQTAIRTDNQLFEVKDYYSKKYKPRQDQGTSFPKSSGKKSDDDYERIHLPLIVQDLRLGPIRQEIAAVSDKPFSCVSNKANETTIQDVPLSALLDQHATLSNAEVGSKKSLLPSRKAERAPPPPSPKHAKQLVDTLLIQNQGVGSQKDIKRLTSRKSERAPDPPRALQKSSSLKISSSNKFEPSESRTIPTYAVVQKHKLSSVLENIPDSQSALKSNNLRELASVQGANSAERTFGYGLRNSHSDASVFLALRNKYQGKIDAEAQNLVMSGVKTSESSSDSDGSYRHLNISDEQKLQKSVSKQRTPMPVAPPRSKRRSTMEIHYVKENIGATNLASYQRSECDISCEASPQLPAKTKEAFQVPDEFRGKSTANEKSRIASLRREVSDRKQVLMHRK